MDDDGVTFDVAAIMAGEARCHQAFKWLSELYLAIVPPDSSSSLLLGDGAFEQKHAVDPHDDDERALRYLCMSC